MRSPPRFKTSAHPPDREENSATKKSVCMYKNAQNVVCSPQGIMHKVLTRNLKAGGLSRSRILACSRGFHGFDRQSGVQGLTHPRHSINSTYQSNVDAKNTISGLPGHDVCDHLFEVRYRLKHYRSVRRIRVRAGAGARAGIFVVGPITVTVGTIGRKFVFWRWGVNGEDRI